MNYLLRGLALVAAAALLVLAGCGGDTETKNDYVGALNKVQTDFADSVQKTTAAPTGGDPAAAAEKTFSNLEGAIDKLVADLKDVDPPGDVKDLHNQLISQMGDFKTAVSKASDSLGSGDPQKLLAAQSAFATAASSLGTKISKTIADINTKLQE
jgi:hypothetical protein